MVGYFSNPKPWFWLDGGCGLGSFIREEKRRNYKKLQDFAHKLKETKAPTKKNFKVSMFFKMCRKMQEDLYKSLEAMFVMPPRFGGEESMQNILFVPVGVGSSRKWPMIRLKRSLEKGEPLAIIANPNTREIVSFHPS